MLFNLLNNTQIGQHCAVPADEGLADIAFVNGWRVLIPAIPEKFLAPTILKREGWEWNMYLYDLANSDMSFSQELGEIPLMADDARFTPYVEDCGDDVDEEDEILELDDPTDDADTTVSFDYVETFHHLNQQ